MSKKTPSLLPRDPHGQIIKDEAEIVKDKLIKKFLSESQHLQKDNSFYSVKGKKRDIIVHMAVTLLPEVEGRQVIGEVEREIGQWAFRMLAHQLPMPNKHALKAFSELSHIGKGALLKLGLVTI